MQQPYPQGITLKRSKLHADHIPEHTPDGHEVSAGRCWKKWDSSETTAKAVKI